MPTVSPKKPLPAHCQKKPPVEAKDKGLWPPEGGTEYTVKDGDNWKSLAKAWGVTPRQLIGFNFNTDDPKEVNWYLENYVGCVKRSPDCCNWSFSSDARPGKIYRPWANYPARPGEPVKYDPTPMPDPVELDPINLPKVSSNFSIRMLGAGAAPLPKIILGVDCIFFEIYNEFSGKSAFYRYTGVGLGAGLKGSATLQGDWERFTTTSPILETDFAGFTRFTAAGGASKSINILHMLGTPPGVAGVYLQISSGFTFGASASFTVGQMILM